MISDSPIKIFFLFFDIYSFIDLSIKFAADLSLFNIYFVLFLASFVQFVFLEMKEIFKI